jgi:HEAT repeat protein
MATRRPARDPGAAARPARKPSRLEAELEALEAACAAPASAEAATRLRAALREGPATIAARAAAIIRQHALDGFADDLVAAFRRLLVDPVKSDPGCVAKVAALEALDFGGHDDAAPFVEATAHVQLEPAWGPPVDTATGVRARGVLALARLSHPDLSVIAGALLADPASPVRQAAAEALASTGDRAQAGALALRFAAGDEDPLVVLACASGLLALAPEHALPRLRAALGGADEEAREVAAMALGQSSRPEALDALVAALDAAALAADRAIVLRALGLQRSERAVEALLGVVANGGLRDAEAAIAGLGTRRFDAGVRERTAAAARRNPEAARLGATLAAAFPAE